MIILYTICYTDIAQFNRPRYDVTSRSVVYQLFIVKFYL